MDGSCVPGMSCFEGRKAPEAIKNTSEQHEQPRVDVFLGGACGETTWRKDVAMPLLKRAARTFYNPQVDKWDPSLMAIEEQAKLHSKTLLFVVGPETRAVASMVEAAFYAGQGRKVYVVVQDITPGAEVEGEKITTKEAKDLNRGRAYLGNLATDAATGAIKNCEKFDTVEEAINKIVEDLKPPSRSPNLGASLGASAIRYIPSPVRTPRSHAQEGVTPSLDVPGQQQQQSMLRRVASAAKKAVVEPAVNAFFDATAPSKMRLP
eukprot:g146.t1